MTTELQQKVWHALTKIPAGKVSTYSLLAHHLGTRAIRAVATAVGKNPNAPEVPCHRVVRSDGTIGKYSGPGGTAGKIALLENEGIPIVDNSVAHFTKHLYTF